MKSAGSFGAQGVMRRTCSKYLSMKRPADFTAVCLYYMPAVLIHLFGLDIRLYRIDIVLHLLVHVAQVSIFLSLGLGFVLLFVSLFFTALFALLLSLLLLSPYISSPPPSLSLDLVVVPLLASDV